MPRMVNSFSRVHMKALPTIRRHGHSRPRRRNRSGRRGRRAAAFRRMRGDVPPALGHPALVVLVAERDADAAVGLVAEPEVGAAAGVGAPASTAPSVQRGASGRQARRPKRQLTKGSACSVAASTVHRSCISLALGSALTSRLSTRMARKSLTLVRSGPVVSRSPSACEKPRRIVVGEKAGRIEAERPARGPASSRRRTRRPDRRRGRRRRRCRRCRRRARRCPACPSSATASASAYSWFGPPRPWPRIVTVSSPPDRMTARRPAPARFAREPACACGDLARFAFELVAEHDALRSRPRSTFALAAAERIGRPRDQRNRVSANSRIAGLGRFVRRLVERARRRRGGRSSRIARAMARRRRASSDRARSGPSRSPPDRRRGTSEIASVMTRAGRRARRAVRP